MKDKTYSPGMESHPIFIKFLEANGLRRVGVDFRLQTGIYEFIELSDSKPAKFNGIELTTAYAGFSDGYCGNPQKNGGPFGSLKPKKEEDGYTKTEILLVNEQSVLDLFESEEKLREAKLLKEVCEGALNTTRNKLYSQQYQLGRQANNLNE